MTSIPNIALNNGVLIPQVGFGVFQIPPAETEAAVLHALEAGYRHIDTAQGYGNEREVGDAIERSGIDPAGVFVTSKLGLAHLTYDESRRAIDETTAALRVKKADLFLVHWPLPTVRDYTIVWRAIVDAYAEGAFRAVGVSNFHRDHLERIRDVSPVVPAVNQIELHPFLTQEPLRRYGAEHGIVTEAWSPIAQGLVLTDPVIVGIAEGVERSAAQVVLRWHVQQGTIVFPKSTTPERIAENIRLFDFALDDDQMAAISALNRNQRTGGDPDTFSYKY
jgi:2,5-diketo-D-gluconate reductase A